jgi:hypothetical protein
MIHPSITFHARRRVRGAHMSNTSITFLIPVFNDWDSVSILLRNLDAVLLQHQERADVLIVDDGSTIEPRALPRTTERALSRVAILKLQRNVGHQRAIAVGIAYLNEHGVSDVVIIMDADGEDRPDDVPALLNGFRYHKQQRIVFAQRAKRLERFSFRLGYHAYRLLHRLLTGIAVKVGNFSVIPRHFLPNLAASSDLWNHYAAAVFKARLPWSTVPCDRGKRYSGRSTMDFVALVTHGLSAISVFGDIVGVRLLLFAGGLVVAVLAALAVVLSVRLATTWAIPGWATMTAGLLLVILVQCLGGALLLSFFILTARAGSTFLPARDYKFFIADVIEVSPSHGHSELPR